MVSQSLWYFETHQQTRIEMSKVKNCESLDNLSEQIQMEFAAATTPAARETILTRYNLERTETLAVHQKKHSKLVSWVLGY